MICWFMVETGESKDGQFDPLSDISMRGIDIGTGISTIAPTRFIAGMREATMSKVCLIQPATPL